MFAQNKLFFTVLLLVASSLYAAPKATPKPVAKPSPSSSPTLVKVDTLEGAVKVVGSAANMETVLVKDKIQSSLCDGDQVNKIRKVSDMTVRVVGEQRRNAQGKPTCFRVAEFTVLQVGQGHTAYVGTIQKEGEDLVLQVNQQKYVLDTESPGLAKLVGKKVVLDLRPSERPSKRENLWKVVSYTEHP